MDRIDKIFRAYDIRGIYPSEVNEKIADRIGRAFIKTGKIKNLVIGRDNRSSSRGLFKAICEGISAKGVDIIDIGLTTTPMFYYAVVKLNLDGGIMITASHNPLKYNGFKIVKKGAEPVDKNDLDKIKKIVKYGQLVGDSGKKGSIIKKDILDDYIDNILSFCHPESINKFRINIDTSNGTAKEVVFKLASKLPIKLTQKKTLPKDADLGVVFDSDGDRLVFIDKKRGRIDPDLIAAILIRYYFNSSGKIVYTVASSRIIKKEAERSRNEAICSKVGHSHIEELMAKEEAVFGSEPSGHYYFKNTYCADSPLVVFLKILEIMSQTKMSLEDLTNQFQKYYKEEIKIKIKNTAQASLFKKIRSFGRTGKISHFDGLTVEYDNWWFNLRASNTEQVMRLTIEADTRELLKEKIKELTPFLP